MRKNLSLRLFWVHQPLFFIQRRSCFYWPHLEKASPMIKRTTLNKTISPSPHFYKMNKITIYKFLGAALFGFIGLGLASFIVPVHSCGLRSTTLLTSILLLPTLIFPLLATSLKKRKHLTWLNYLNLILFSLLFWAYQEILHWQHLPQWLINNH